MLGLITAGLSFLPQIKDMWGSVSKILGIDEPKDEKGALDLVEKAMDAITGDNVDPKIKQALELAVMQHKETILKLQNERALIVANDEKHKRDTASSMMSSDVGSDDPFVSQNRSKILRSMWKTIQVYMGVTLFLYFTIMIYFILKMFTQIPEGVVSTLPTAKDISEIVTLFTKYPMQIFQWLIGLFGTAFCGYTASKTVDNSTGKKHFLLNKMKGLIR